MRPQKRLKVRGRRTWHAQYDSRRLLRLLRLHCVYEYIEHTFEGTAWLTVQANSTWQLLR